MSSGSPRTREEPPGRLSPGLSAGAAFLDLALTGLLSPADDPERPVSLHVRLPGFLVRVLHR